MLVQPIKPEEMELWFKRRHYARRMPIVLHAFGLFHEGKLVGVISYGPCPTPQVPEFIFGGQFKDRVMELNRLCVDTDQKNASSYLVGNSLQMLPKPTAVVSYADTRQKHIGYIYQATNFIYTGAVTAHDHEYIIAGKRVHPRSLASMGITAPTEWAKTNNIQTAKAEPKHRYLFLCGSKREKRDMLRALTYPIVPNYPKGDGERYDVGEKVPVQMTMFI